MAQTLPIHDVLRELLSALEKHTGAVLVAPPGAGKTTAVAPALIGERWCTGQIILTTPRRVAARAAAERMAEMLGEKPGETVGYLTRMDSKSSVKTRVLIVTEAILVNRLIADPELEGVTALLFDEAHERNLDSDLGLALALETRDVLRPDLRILVMSATIDGAKFAQLMGANAPVIESEGKAHPLQIEWLGSSPQKRADEAVADAVMQAWREQQGDILAFLPGVGEIERTRERLAARLPDVPVLPLHGQIKPPEQRAAIRRDPNGRRRIVLATSIAETSLTLDGVSVVVDSGLSRYAEFDRAAGTSRLVTRTASQASADQRAGRAARQAPGVAYRLWEEGGHAGRPAYSPPEIETADLAPVVLSLAKWGCKDPREMRWLDEPPEASLASARQRLESLGALYEDGGITPHGSQIATLPMDPVSGAAVLFGAEVSQALDAAKLVLLTQERGLGGRGEDLLERLRHWDNDRSSRANAARKLAERWANAAERLVSGAEGQEIEPVGFVAMARPDFVAKRRDSSGEQWISAGGRGYRLDPSSTLGREDWIVICDSQGSAKEARITAAAALSDNFVDTKLAHRIEKHSQLRWNAAARKIEARLVRCMGAITLASGPDPQPNDEAIEALLLEKAKESIRELLPAGLIARAMFAGVEALSAEALAESADLWLAPLLEGRRDLAISKGKLFEAVLGILDWENRQQLDREAPREFLSPAGTRHLIDYTGDEAPSAEVRVQALFGLDRHPMIGTSPLLLKLTSPAGRPIQSTRDLPGFWRGSWADVRKDMKGRYPKHRWPEEPWSEKPSLKTKNAFSRDAE